MLASHIETIMVGGWPKHFVLLPIVKERPTNHSEYIDYRWSVQHKYLFLKLSTLNIIMEEVEFVL